MTGGSFSRRVAGTLAGVLPPAARRELRRRLGHRVGIPGAEAGLVSVVVVVEPVDLARLRGALASVLGQPHAFLEVLVCPVAWADRDLGVVLAGSDDVRVRVLASRDSWAEAADDGAAVASGEFIVFLRGCDRLAPQALGRAAGALADAEAGLALGRVEQAGEPEPWLERSQRALHATAATDVEPRSRPDLAGALTIGGAMVRRTAWHAGGHRFGPDDDWLLSPTMAGLLATVPRVCVLDAATYLFSHDHGTRAFGATPNALAGLGAWRHRAELVEAELTGPLADGWVRQVLGVELPRLLQDTERATSEQWAELRSLVERYAAKGSPELPVAARALVTLALEDRRADLELLAAEIAASGEDLPTTVRDGVVLADWPVPGLELPDEVRPLTIGETGLRLHLQRTTWGSDGREIEVFVAVDHVDLGSLPTAIRVRTAAGEDLAVRELASLEATRWLGRRFQSARAVVVEVPGRLDTELLVEVSVAGLSRAGRLVAPGPTSHPEAGPVRVTDLALDGTRLAVSVDGDPELLRLLDASGRPVAAAFDRGTPGVVRISLQADLFGTPTWLGAGGYRLVTPEANVSLSDRLRDRMPVELAGERHRVRAHLGPAGGLVLGLLPPLADDELGPYAQQQLRTAYALTERTPEPGLFYFETYAGRTATDSPRPIFEELRRRRPDARICWGVADHSQLAPSGAEPVLLRSRAWYDVLARAACIVTNTDVEPWFRRRPGQFLLQTFHGYPSKAMGRDQWLAKDYGPARIREFRARGVDTWSTILTPTPEMTRHYREQYDYRGPAFEHGYPRNDDLVLPEADRRRVATRRVLGLADDQVAVLYAPTWRDHLASRPRAAEMTDFLDVEAASRALGDRYVLLLRGHRFHTPATTAAGVVDVTAYPEVNDLILASDAAVLDYSSLRFDYALTGKPMVFLVPDLADYSTGSRRFLFPFEESAPGPLVRDTAAVVAELSDLGRLRERHAAAITAFNARYNPWQDGQATERVVDQLLGALDLPASRVAT